MKTTSGLGLMALIAATALLCACSPSVTWTESVYATQGFAVSFPQAPQTGTPSGGFITQVTTTEFDMGVVAMCGDGKSSDQLLSDTVDAIRRQGTVRNLTYTAISQIMGREMLVDRPGLATVRERVFVKGKCLYQVYASAQGGPDDALVIHFLDSFRFL